ncbi:PREDICTED: putative fatty acid desaturase 2-like protein FADS2P1 isoform X1 [Cercocebus atys]|uniref:Cytochrome b5 heme-binding domain-containing protein n=2 Tax=Cercopithecinae TaxID=9528 RepID=A0A2K5KRX3_CERAT|nr:PREDICTED: putative fatty acid desaturase 2-like protein FADS2P1 isoform X1 [Cercocebus atys]XP_011947757.1 PREDICTED: putative fatty acid desaturase 2-like protein FADS2P1 isoform X1 [Cercocebus atys]
MTMKFEEKCGDNGSLVGRNQSYPGEKHQPKGKPVTNGEAEFYAKQEANGKCSVPRKRLNMYTWQEIQRHNQEADQWLVINRKVYNVSSWADRHPGGRRVLNHYAGEDATDVFRAMHPEPDIVQLYLKPLLIGELAPGEHSQERHKNSQLVKDFQELRRIIESMNMFHANLGFFFLHFAQILMLEMLAWLILYHFGSGWPVTIFISFLLTISQAQSSFLQHDVGHLSIFKKSKWNHVMHKFVMCHLKGLSANWWNYRHFQHHVKPNIYPKDPDIDMGPLFLLGDSQPVKYGKKKIKYINYEKQHLYFYMVGLPLLMPVYFNLQSMQVMYLRRYWVDIAWVSSFYIRYFITFGPYYGIFGTVLLIYLVKFLESPWIAYVTQMSHIPMRMSTEENRDWLSTQVLATCNIEQSFFNDWFTGHLNFQIEHHLFPTMPRHNYHKVAPLVRSLCAKHGLQYVNKPMLRAFGDIVRALKKSAALWVDAYYET